VRRAGAGAIVAVEYHHPRAEIDSPVEILDVLIEQANAARGDEFPDG
jgi:hypothetical protein